MSDKYSFLPHFMDDTIYVIKEEIPSTMPENRDETKPSMPENNTGSNQNTTNFTENSSDISTTNDILFSGNNTRDILILVEEDNEEFIGANDKIFLNKILKAIGVNIENVALVNLIKQPVEDISRLSPINYSTIISFTHQFPSFLTLDATDRYTSKNINGKNVVFCHKLKDINNDREKKVMLWEQLKRLFPAN